jgi:hypothetical protein
VDQPWVHLAPSMLPYNRRKKGATKFQNAASKRRREERELRSRWLEKKFYKGTRRICSQGCKGSDPHLWCLQSVVPPSIGEVLLYLSLQPKWRTGQATRRGVEWEPQIRSENQRRKNPDTNTTPQLLKCANTTQHGQAASARNTIRVSQNFCGIKTREHTQSDSKTSWN